MSDQQHVVAAQALGYLYQFERATFRLLSSSNSVVSVGVEHLDDVSEFHADRKVVREQDKSTIKEGKNTLADASVALWKTLAIWAEAACADEDVLSRTEFHLVTNGAVSESCLAHAIHCAGGSGAERLAAELVQRVAKLRADLQPFGKKIAAVPLGVLAELLRRVFVFDRVCGEFGGRLADVASLRYIGDAQRTAVFDATKSWVERRVRTAAVNGAPCTVERAAFDREAAAILRRVLTAPIAASFAPSSSGPVDPGSFVSHGFFRQLDWIDVDPDYARECATNFAYAKAARVKWAADPDRFSEEAIIAYETDLKARWNLQRFKQGVRTYASPEVQGQDLLGNTLDQDVPLDGQTLPHTITAGNFHALADFDEKRPPQLGWHPDFSRLASDESEDL